MIVLDASVMVDLLWQDRAGQALLDRLAADGPPWHAPQVLDLEVLNAVRREAQRGALTESRALEIVSDLERIQLVRHDHLPLLRRIWRLRANLTAYDAAYVALARRLGATLLTRDARLGRAPGLGVDVEVV